MNAFKNILGDNQELINNFINVLNTAYDDWWKHSDISTECKTIEDVNSWVNECDYFQDIIDLTEYQYELYDYFYKVYDKIQKDYGKRKIKAKVNELIVEFLTDKLNINYGTTN